MIGSKVLDIFYNEFVKFIPAHLLQREEETKLESKDLIKKRADRKSNFNVLKQVAPK